ncbi:transmembrane protein 201 isoform X4 [Vombatus ursinus]|uniref:transmembrane protein 201 isoform X4 n=1 Tax=Vombatus ursinus TaxID=29139 RepID=UPI000FFDA86F|nr:transmembrane protein 201 isoform X4 [Vombatus ursinus]
MSETSRPPSKSLIKRSRDLGLWKKPTHTTVNCWFCNQDTVVPYGNRNCWDCPNCEQYNGFQENGDYNKPIPAQYLEHLNHVVTSAAPFCDSPQPQQWVSSQVLLCKKCNNHQTTKIKQLASFAPREESFCSSPVTAPAQVILLRFLAFLICSFLLVTALSGSGHPFSPAASWTPALLAGGNVSSPGTSASSNTTADAGALGWQQLLHLLPEHVLEKLCEAWDLGQSHQVVVVALGLLACLLAMLLAGRIRLRRIDAFSSFLWFLVLGLHLVERYLEMDPPSWLDTLKFSATSLCCLVGLTAAVATRKATGQRRYRPRRYLSGDSNAYFPGSNGLAFPYPPVSPTLFVPAPPTFFHLTNQQLFRSPRRTSSSSLPGRLNRALSLGTIPSLTRADSGYLFSGSRPPSQGSQSKEAPLSDYFTLLSGSCASSPLPSPAPSIAGSVGSSSGSLRLRRPLISPARLNLKGQKLLLFPSPGETPHSPSSSNEPSLADGGPLNQEFSRFPSKRQPAQGLQPMRDLRSHIESGSICSDHSVKKEDGSSRSSACVVDTTTKGCLEEAVGWKARFGNSVVQGLLAVSLAANALFTSAYLYQSLR